jgi:hypothetical protein
MSERRGAACYVPLPSFEFIPKSYFQVILDCEEVVIQNLQFECEF